MKAKKQDRKTLKAGKPALKIGAVGKVKTLGTLPNHNETLVREA